MKLPEQFAKTTLYSRDGNELQQPNVHRQHKRACMWEDTRGTVRSGDADHRRTSTYK